MSSSVSTMQCRRLKEVILYSVPAFDKRGGCSPVLEVRSAPTQHKKSKLLFSSSIEISNGNMHAAKPRSVLHPCLSCAAPYAHLAAW